VEREWLERPFYRQRRATVGAMGGVHGQWLSRADVRGDVGGSGGVTSLRGHQQGAGKGEGSSGEREFEREASRGGVLRVQGFGAAWAKALLGLG
jgi:hypothetical protein